MADKLHGGSNHSFEILGSSAASGRLRAEIARAAPFDSNVLVTGPSGSGKELVARNLHALSSRSGGRFIPVDCASLFGELMASQLFGHVEGAFTGATFSALGCFRAAHEGTIFLDEIGELELPLQARLLRVVQERVVTPVGSHEGTPIDVRIIAATNRDLQEEVAAGRFREDLYFRLNVVSIHTLPLQDRRDDISELSRAFLKTMAINGLPHCTLSPGALEALQDYAWPGNARQLKNLLEQAVIVSDSELITLSLVQSLLADTGACQVTGTLSNPVRDAPDAKPLSRTPSTQDLADEDATWPTLEKLERDHILYTLEHTYYNQSAAARLLGISRQALIRLMKKFDISVPELSGKPRPRK